MKAGIAALAMALAATVAVASSHLTEGEVRKVDRDTGKITLKHGEIRNLGMPAMSMVFVVKDPAMLEKLKAGDRVMFSAEKIKGAYTVVHIETAK
jgi:Cu/Ag efflux protein CusF